LDVVNESSSNVTRATVSIQQSVLPVDRIPGPQPFAERTHFDEASFPLNGITSKMIKVNWESEGTI
jgi:hypothetical protein